VIVDGINPEGRDRVGRASMPAPMVVPDIKRVEERTEVVGVEGGGGGGGSIDWLKTEEEVVWARGFETGRSRSYFLANRGREGV